MTVGRHLDDTDDMTPPVATPSSAAHPAPPLGLVLRPEQIAERSWQPLRGIPGVETTLLWRNGDNVVGLIRIASGHSKPPHTHHAAHHHMWIVSGNAVMLGKPVEQGSYIYVPPGVEHEVDEVGPAGVMFLYTHRTLETTERNEFGTEVSWV